MRIYYREALHSNGLAFVLYLQGDMHMVAARLGCERVMVGTGWANSHPGCMHRLRNHCSHLVEGSRLARKAAWALSECMTTKTAACSLMSGHG